MLGLIFGILGIFGFSDPACPADSIPAVDSAKIFTVNRVLIIGNKVTKDRIIARELTLKPGDTISLRRLDKTLVWDKRKIYNLRLFNTVTVRSLELSSGLIDLLVEVTERWYIFPVPIFELSDRNFSEWWQNYHHDLSRVNYGLSLYRYNFRGRNETVQLNAQFGFSQKFDMSYRIPYVDKKLKHGLSFNFSYDEPKNLAYKTLDHKLVFLKGAEPLRISYGGSIGYTYRKSFFETHNLQIGYRDMRIKSIVADSNANYFQGDQRYQVKYTYLSYQFNSEHRDVVQYPLRGYQVNGYIQQNGLGSKDINYLEGNISYARHWALKKNFFLSNYSSVYASTPTNIPYAFFGGMGYRRQFVRGYEVYVVETPMFLLNKTTFKKRIFYKVMTWDAFPMEQFRYFPFAIYIKAYTDWGYAENYPYYTDQHMNTRLTDKLMGGWGGGLDFVMLYDTVIRMEYSFTNLAGQGFFLSLKKEF